MASGTFSDYLIESWLSDLKTVWISLHYSDPSVDGNYASEVFGGSYGRVQATFTDPVGRVIFNDQDALFRGMPSIRVSHVGGWDSQYNGNMLFSAPLATPTTVLPQTTFRVGAETLAISLP